MTYTAIIHRTLLHPRLRELLAEYEGEQGGFQYSSPLGFVQFVASDMAVLGKPASHTPYPNGLVLRAEIVSKEGSSSFEMLKFRHPDWKVCDTNLADAPNINWDAFKEWCLDRIDGNMLFAKLFAYSPTRGDVIEEECKALGYTNLDEINKQLAHIVTGGAYPAGEKFSVPTRQNIDDFDDFLLAEDGKSVSFGILKRFSAQHQFWKELEGKKVLHIGGSIFLIKFCAVRDQYEFTLANENEIIFI